jgi:predicted DNA-binding ribbon-helix-helix protein
MTQETREILNKKMNRAEASMKLVLKEHGVPKNRKLEEALFLILESMAEDAYFNGQMDGIKGDAEKPYWSSARV